MKTEDHWHMLLMIGMIIYYIWVQRFIWKRRTVILGYLLIYQQRNLQKLEEIRKIIDMHLMRLLNLAILEKEDLMLFSKMLNRQLVKVDLHHLGVNLSKP